MSKSMAADVHSMASQAGDLVDRHVQLARESRFVGSHVLGKQPTHNFRPDRLGQLTLEKAFEHGHLARIVAMLLRHCPEILFPALEPMFRTKLRQRGKNLVQQLTGVGNGREDKVNFVDVQYRVLEDRLGRGKETTLDASRIQEREYVRKVVAVAVVES